MPKSNDKCHSGRGQRALDALLTPTGQELLTRLAHAEPAADTELRLAETLRREYPAELVTAALAQAELRRRAGAKFDGADTMYFTRDGLEQASAAPIARHRAARLAGGQRVADLCTGIGGDLVALAAVAEAVLAVDRDPLHLRMAGLNADALGVGHRVRTLLTDVRDARLPGATTVFVDPARRVGGRRARPGASEPPLSWCTALVERVPGVCIKAAPGIDRDSLPAGWEAEFVADGRELKEAVLWSPALAGASSRATLLPAGDQLLPEPGDAVACRPPGEFLLDPNPAVTRAGLVEDLARRVDTWKIDERIAFLSADVVVHTPFARTLRVLDSAPWREKALAARLRALDIGSLDIRRRGLAGDVEALHRRLRPALAAGSRPATLVMTRVGNRPWAVICADAART